MPITRIQSFDTGAGYTIQIERDLNGALALLSSEDGDWLSRLEVDGTQVSVARYTDYPNLRYGSLDLTSDGRYLFSATHHAGLGAGQDVQIIDRTGAAATALINPWLVNGTDEGVGGWTIAATANGGFVAVANDGAHASDVIPVTHPDGTYNASAGVDVRVRYFDAAGTAITAPVVADSDVEAAGDTTASRRYGDQYIQDTERLAGGQTAFVYIDTRAVGGPQANDGFHNENQLSLQISTPGSVGEPVKVDITPFNQAEGLYYSETLVNGIANPDIVALPDGTLAVVWTENSYVRDESVWLNYRQDGWDTYIRYYDAGGTALTDPIEVLHRGMDMGNISKRVFAESIGDGRIVVAWNDGVYGVNGNGIVDAYMGVVAVRGAGMETSRINPQAAQNTQGYSLFDLAVRTDGTVEVAYNDAQRQENGYNLNHSVVERFSLGIGFNGVVSAGGAGDEALSGSTRHDQIAGWGGDDVIRGLAGRDELFGNTGADRLFGDDGADRLYGNEGDDVLEGGADGDALYGGDGLDSASYAGAASLVRIDLSTGKLLGGDTRGDSYVSIEGLIGTAFNDVLTGDDGINRLDGGAGIDRLTGGAGDDIYVVDNKRDVIVELADGGTDTVHAGFSYVLGDMLENLVLDGVAAIGTGNDVANTITGNGAVNTIRGLDGDDTLYGMGGNDVLDGGAGFDQVYGGDGDDRITSDGGNDRFYGGAGDDLYILSGGANPQVYEDAGGGIDTVRSASNFYSFGMQEIEIIQLVGNVAGVVYGSDTANRITGNAIGNYLVGYGGDDTIYGMAGDDVLLGGTGDDMLVGGRGADTLRGEGGADIFAFEPGDTGATRDPVDRIQDFSHDEGDRIALSKIDAIAGTPENDRFAFIGTAAFSGAAGELRYEQDGSNTFLLGDTNGDGVADLAIRLDGLHDLVRADIVL